MYVSYYPLLSSLFLDRVSFFLPCKMSYLLLASWNLLCKCWLCCYGICIAGSLLLQSEYVWCTLIFVDISTCTECLNPVFMLEVKFCILLHFTLEGNAWDTVTYLILEHKVAFGFSFSEAFDVEKYSKATISMQPSPCTFEILFKTR